MTLTLRERELWWERKCNAPMFVTWILLFLSFIHFHIVLPSFLFFSFHCSLCVVLCSLILFCELHYPFNLMNPSFLSFFLSLSLVRFIFIHEFLPSSFFYYTKLLLTPMIWCTLYHDTLTAIIRELEDAMIPEGERERENLKNLVLGCERRGF